MTGHSRGSAMARKMNTKLSQNLMLAGLDESASALFTTQEIEASTMIQRQFKAHMFRKKIDAKVEGTQQIAQQSAR